MSYILDALKKATVEREHLHGSIPNLNAQPVRANLSQQSGVDVAHRRGRLTAAMLLFAACAVVAGAAVVWRITSTSAKAPLVPVTAVAEPGDRHSSPVAALSMPAPAAPADPVMPPPFPSASAPPPRAADALPAAKATRPQPATARPEASPLTPKPSSVSLPALPALPALPDSAPKLVVSGSTYSENPAYRVLIVNGQVYREAESPAAGVTIKSIGARAAVALYDGKEFLIRY